MEDEENAAPGLSQEEEESRSDEEAQEQRGGPAGPAPGEDGVCREEDHTRELRDEASSVTRELDEHELDYDEEVPEEPGSAAQEEEAEKAGAEEEEEKGEGAPGAEGRAGVHSVEDKEPPEACKEKRREDDDGEIDDGEIDVSTRAPLLRPPRACRSSGGAGVGAGGGPRAVLGAVTMAIRKCWKSRRNLDSKGCCLLVGSHGRALICLALWVGLH